MSLCGEYGFMTLWVIVSFLLSNVFCQEPTLSSVDFNLTTTAFLEPKLCVNGELDEDTNLCVCLAGWTGRLCESCVNSRLRLTEESGLIFDGINNYQSNVQCLFYIEANSSASAVHLRVRSFHTECQWDALNVFDGDSIFSPKIAAYTGDIIELPLEDPTEPMENSTTSSPPTLEPVPVQYQSPTEITLSSSGSQMLLYFYTDGSAVRPGFEIAYWVDYACPDNCSEQGVCENGSCVCDAGWTGTFCHITVCPNNCSENGVCDMAICVCFPGYTGADCSISVSSPHWERVDTVPLPHNLTLSTLARASHSAVVWGDYMLVYGGHQFPIDDYYFRTEPPEINETVLNDVEPEVTILRYQFSTRSWDEVVTYSSTSEDSLSNNHTNGSSDELPTMPQPRYGHTAVIYNDIMYVYGGSLLPSEQITNEFWALDLNNFTWTLIPGPSTNSNSTVTSPESSAELLPLPVRSHTAHVVGNRMIALFGLSSSRTPFLPYVQEYNFDTGEWSLPHMSGVHLSGLLGHSSVLDPASERIYIHGGGVSSRSGVGFIQRVVVLDTTTYELSFLPSEAPARYLHSSVLIGPLLVTFGGCEAEGDDTDCFKNDTHAYNILCDSWEELTLPGLPGNSSRYGHSSVVDPTDGSLLVFGGYLGTFHHDLLRLNSGNCSRFGSETECVGGSGLCVWSGASGQCVGIDRASVGGDFTYQCSVDTCLRAPNCSSCNLVPGCGWNTDLHYCHKINSSDSDTSQCPGQLSSSCSYFRSCFDCENHGCSWGMFNSSNAVPGCVSNADVVASSRPFITAPCSTATPCFARTDCSSCVDSCIWCASLNQCSPSYPLTYIYAQCLGWSSRSTGCPQECDSYENCDDCRSNHRCGWCNDPSDTGLGSCVDGGFNSPRENSSCGRVDQSGLSETWNFDQCPACQCNGHSTCVNGSVCIECEDKTTGTTCETCDSGYFGNARNGGVCAECDCNGYNPVCDIRDGTCTCLSFFVGGDHCERCTASHLGDPGNFCYVSLSTGFIYSFDADRDNEIQGFFVATPPEDRSFHFLLEVTSNPTFNPIVMQLFLGKLSEDLWILTNLTDSIELNQGSTYETNLGSFGSNSNASLAQLFSFTNLTLRNSSNFTELLVGNSESQYTNNMWDGDVSLVIYLSNLTNPSSFKITVDQSDYIFLLYFFATFTICFSVLILVFLLGWYIKRKLEYRAFVRAQYIELQRRVARPFARIKAIIRSVTPPTPDSPPPVQHPTYVAVETCQDGKAAVLSLFVRLPGDHKTGRPSPGRSGLAIASTLVNVNPSKKKSKKSRKEGSTSGDESSSNRRTSSSGTRIRLREVTTTTTHT